ncbi:MAG: peptidase U32 family protein [Clostridiaceae bacterium]
MVKAINFMHLHGCRIYMTVNTLVKEKEMSDLYSYLKPYYEAGLDAVLVQDMGVLTYIRKHFPDLPVHISTQMTVTGEIQRERPESPRRCPCGSGERTFLKGDP